MSESAFLTPGSSPRPTSTIELAAAIEWKGGRHAPELFVSFDGLNEPAPLFAELVSIGWLVSARPPRPSSAIEWIPDPTTGENYTLHPWQVEDFKIDGGDWDRETVPDIIALTEASLLRHGVQVAGKPANPAANVVPTTPAAAGQAEPTGASPEPGAVSQTPAVTAPLGPPQIVLLGYTGAPHPRFSTAIASAGGRKREAVAWAESADAIAMLCPTGEARLALAADSAHAWEVRYLSAPAVLTSPGQAYICAAVPGTPADDKKLSKLVSMLGGNVQVAALTPIDPSRGEAGALVFGIVPAANVELATSTLRLRCREAIVRGDAG